MNYFAFLLLAGVIVTLAPARAHPGHDLMEHGGAHVVSSVYHLFVVAAVAALCFGISALATNQVLKRTMNRFGLAGLVSFAVLWMIRH
jgi:H+/gluconate symporter-like permease